MALTDTLESAFGEGGFALDATFTALTGTLTGTSPPGADLDDGAIGQIADLLATADLGALATPVQTAIGQAGATAAGLPQAGELLAPLTTALDAVEQLTRGDALNVMRRLEEAAAGAPGAVGLTGLTSRLSALGEAQSQPGLQAVLALLRELVPSLDLQAPVDAVATNAPALAALARLVGSLMAVESLTGQLSGTAGLVGGMLDAGAAAASIRRVEAWREVDLAARLTGLDPDDEAAALAALAPVADFTSALRDTAALLVRGLAFGEATLVDADLPALAARLDHATAALTESALDPVRRGVLSLTARLDPLLAIELGPPAASLEAALADLTGFVGELTAAIETFDTAALTRPVTSAFDAVLEPLRRFEALAREVIAAIQGAFGTIRQALEAIDLRSVAAALQTALRPVVEALQRVESLIGEAQAAIETVARAVTTAMGDVQTALGGAATTVNDAFTRIQRIVEGLELAELEAELREGIQTVVDALERAQLAPYFEAGIEVMDTAADVVAAVPIDLLPDDARREVEEAVAPIKAIDFDSAVRDVLIPRMREILDAVDEDVLAAVDEAYRQVLAFLEDIDPRAALETLEADAFDPMLERVRAIDPVAVLEPVQSVLDDLQAAIAGLDLGRDVLDPLDVAFDEVADAITAFDPGGLIAPIEERVDAAREGLLELIALDTLPARLDEADAFVDRVVARIDFPLLVSLLDAVFDDLRPRPDSAPTGISAVGTLLDGLLADTGVALRMDAFDTVRGWIGGVDAASDVRARLQHAAATLETTAAGVRALDLPALVAAAQPVYRDVQTAVEALPAGTVARRHADAVLAGAAPLELFGAVLANSGRYADALDAAAALLRRLAGSGRSELTVIARGLRDALAPLQALPDRVMALLARLGADVENRTLTAVLADVTEVLRPSSVLAPLTPAVDALTAKLAALAHEGLIAPLRTSVADVQAAIDAFDLSFLRTELDALYDQLTRDVEALRPSTLIGPVVSAADGVLQAAAEFDPFAPVRDLIDDMKAAIDAVAEQFRPTVLFAPVLAAYDHVLELAGGLDVRSLLDPVLAALDAIEAQLEQGLQDAAAALTRLQEALP